MRQGLRLEPVLQAISDFLDDQQDVIERVRSDLVRGLKNAATGRSGLTPQQVLRSLVLMRVKNWSSKRSMSWWWQPRLGRRVKPGRRCGKTSNRSRWCMNP